MVFRDILDLSYFNKNIYIRLKYLHYTRRYTYKSRKLRIDIRYTHMGFSTIVVESICTPIESKMIANIFIDMGTV